MLTHYNVLLKETALWFALFELDTEAVRGVDYAGDVSPSLFIKSKFVPRTFSLDSCVLDMLRF